MMLTLLAEVMDKNKFDPNFMGQLLVCLAFLMTLGTQIYGIRRKPALEVDLAEIKKDVATIKDGNETHRDLQDQRHRENSVRLDGIAVRLSQGDEVMTDLQVKQAVNSESIKNISLDVHHMKNTNAVIANKVAELAAQNKKRS